MLVMMDMVVLIPLQSKCFGISESNPGESSLQYLCASYNPIKELDLREFTALKFVELFNCYFLDTLKLGSNPVLKDFVLKTVIWILLIYLAVLLWKT